MEDKRDGFLERLRRGPLLFDGGMGSMLIAQGLEPGAPPEEWNQTRPVAVRRVHDAYLDAGADVVTTNTFGSTPARLEGFGLVRDLADLNNAAIRIVNEAIGDRKKSGTKSPAYAAFSMGPTGKMLSPVGKTTEKEIEREFDAQVQSVDEPFDLVLGETFFDVREALIALAAAKRTFDVPIGVGLTFNKNPRGFFTVMGDPAATATKKMVDAGADFVAVNCSLASADMLDLVNEVRGTTKKPLLCQPNAGDPAVIDGKPVYAQRPEDFADDIVMMIEAGVNAVGGCCGTSPEFIRLARNKMGPA